MAITFDTLEYAQTLIDAGFTDKQARTITQSQKAVLNESTEYQLATKMDILRLENKIDKISQELRSEMEQNSLQLRNDMDKNVQKLESSISSLEKRFDSNMAMMRTLGIAIFVALFGVWLKLLF